MAKILLFHVSEEKKSKIEEICKNLDIKVKIVPKKNYNQTLGYLCDVPGFEKNKNSYDEQEFCAEMIVFQALQDKILDDFLNLYKNSGLEPIKRKAVLTIYNMQWTAQTLFLELSKEIH